MRRSTALELLPAAHARILRLAGQGLDDNELASVLGVDRSAIRPLLRVAQEKLAALEALHEPSERGMRDEPRDIDRAGT